MIKTRLTRGIISLLLLWAVSASWGETPLGTGFTYQGQLKYSGQPADGGYDLRFTLWDSSDAGMQVGGVDCHDDVTVINGLFTVELNAGGEFGPSAFTGAARFLAIEVREGDVGDCNNPNGFTPLSPRQSLSATPYALQSVSSQSVVGIDGHSLDAADGSPVDALAVDNVGNVGIGTSGPGAALHVHGPTDESGSLQLSSEKGPFNSHVHYGATGDWYIRSASNVGKVILQDTGGNVGIGVTNPQTLLQVADSLFVSIPTSDCCTPHPSPGCNDPTCEAEICSINPDCCVTTWGGSCANLAPALCSDCVSPAPSRIGIRAPSPGALLHLNGPIVTSGTLWMSSDKGPNISHVHYGQTGDWYIRSATTNGKVVLQDAGGFVGIGTTVPNPFLLAVNGAVAKPGGGSWSIFSDSRLKHNVARLSGTLDRLLSLHGYEFTYNAEAVEKKMGLPGRQVGLIAQEVERVFPDWVGEDADGYKFVTERATTALMVEALRDLRAEKDWEIAEKGRAIKALRAEMDRQLAERDAEIAALRADVGELKSMEIGRASCRERV